MSEDNEFSDGPPCLQKLAATKIVERPEVVLRQMVVYAKQKDFAHYDDAAMRFSHTYFAQPLPLKKIQEIISDVRRRPAYRCRSQPCASHCELAQCMTRTYGVGDGTYCGVTFGALTKHVVVDPSGELTDDPPHYTWTINGVDIRFDDFDELFSQAKWQRKVAGAVNALPKVLKRGEWEALINEKLRDVQTVREPFEVGLTGQFMTMLWQYLSESVGATSWQEVDQGRPMFVVEDGRRRAYFRWATMFDFIRWRSHLRTRITAQQAWTAMRKYGDARRGEHKYRVNRKVRWWRVDLPDGVGTFDADDTPHAPVDDGKDPGAAAAE